MKNQNQKSTVPIKKSLLKTKEITSNYWEDLSLEVQQSLMGGWPGGNFRESALR